MSSVSASVEAAFVTTRFHGDIRALRLCNNNNNNIFIYSLLNIGYKLHVLYIFLCVNTD